MTRRVWVWFTVYCLFSASAWLLPPTPIWFRGSVLAAVGLASLVLNRAKAWNRLGDVLGLGLVSILFLGIPELLTGWSQHRGSGLGTAASSLIPVILVLVVAQRGVQDGSEVRRFLLPAVIGFGGILLLIPVGLPGSLIGWIALVLFGVTAALVAVASVE